jgi:endonuclease YncB( thermonuclease family)
MATYQKKAPQSGAFFVLLSCLLHAFIAQTCLAADCKPLQETVPHAVRYVIDGDSLRLQSGEEVRLIGIDTPELGYDGRADKPFARLARAALMRLIEAAGWSVRLQPGLDRRDRYRRLLAHVYTPGGDNLTAAMLRQGLGYQAIVAPNLSHLECYRAAEREARDAGRALWREGVRNAKALSADETGFHLIQDRVLKVGRSRHAVWLELMGGASVKIPWHVWQAMTEQDADRFVDRQLEVRGWFYRVKGSLRVKISHPASIRWL